MAIIRYNPMRELFEVEKEFNRLFSDFDRRFGFGSLRERDENFEDAVWAPLSDIYEDSDNFMLKLDLPGLTKDDVKISYSDGQIMISGERKQEKETENHNYHRIERSFGKFYRSFDLPKEINEEKIDAEFKNGQLTVTIPKSEKAKPKQIDVKVS